MQFDLHFVDTNPDVCEELYEQFSIFPNVEVYERKFQDVEDYDCLVSPANSFGMMDGGIDKDITEYFGNQLERRVQEHILSNYSGEQPVGTSFIIPTHHPNHPFLAHTPTMQTPQDITGTKNVYYAMKAMLSAVQEYNVSHGNPIQTVLCPGMGTLCGNMMASEAVAQMLLAYQHFIFPPKEINAFFMMQRKYEIDAVTNRDV